MNYLTALELNYINNALPFKQITGSLWESSCGCETVRLQIPLSSFSFAAIEFTHFVKSCNSVRGLVYSETQRKQKIKRK